MEYLKVSSVYCVCGSLMRLLYSQKWGRYFYGCSQYPECRVTIGAYPDGRPMGMPADDETRKLRAELHKKLYDVWDYNDAKKRREMYVWLSKHTKTGHVSMMDKNEILQTMEKVEALVSNYSTT